MVRVRSLLLLASAFAVSCPAHARAETKAEQYCQKALSEFESGDWEAAIADCNRAIALKPDYEMAYCGRGVVKIAKRDYDGAIADFDRAIALKPDDATAHFNRGEM